MSDRLEKLDVFESVFRSADKARFELEPRPLSRGLLLTDREGAGTEAMLKQVRAYLAPVRTSGTDEEILWQGLGGESTKTLTQLKSALEAASPDLVALHRNLGDPEDPIVHSLGVIMDELTQWSPYPVLVLPGRETVPADPPKSVMVLTDRLAANNRLVNMGLQFTAPGGRLHLVDIEDRSTFDRYMQIIERIPDINSDLAREKIQEKLLDESRSYIASCEEVLRDQVPPVQVKSEVVLGHHINEIRQLARDHGVDLIVMNTRDESQLAMHGMAYAVAVEFRDIPLLMC